MVKELSFSLRVEGCSARDLHNAVYVGSAAMEAYHREANQDLHVTVSPWGSEEPATQTRTVSFTMPIKAPDFIKRSIGADRMRVQESQRLAWGADGKQRSFTVCSEPVLEFPGSSKFATTATLTVRDDEGGAACLLLECVVRCSAGLPWPLASSVEAIMAEQASASVQGYLAFCKQRCQEQAAQRDTAQWQRSDSGGSAAVAASLPARSAAGPHGQQQEEEGARALGVPPTPDRRPPALTTSTSSSGSDVHPSRPISRRQSEEGHQFHDALEAFSTPGCAGGQEGAEAAAVLGADRLGATLGAQLLAEARGLREGAAETIRLLRSIERLVGDLVQGQQPVAVGPSPPAFSDASGSASSRPAPPLPQQVPPAVQLAAAAGAPAAAAPRAAIGGSGQTAGDSRSMAWSSHMYSLAIGATCGYTAAVLIARYHGSRTPGS